MFKTILIGYDGTERGAEATALAETLRDPATGTLRLIRSIPSDSASHTLATVAEAEQADLVVVGSTPERLLHDASCPVAVAPRGYCGGDIRRIGVAHDGSDEADAALRAAESLALELPAALTVYCVVEPPSPSTDLLDGVLDNAPRCLKPEWLHVHGVPAREIAGRAYGVVDLLFVGSGGHGPVRRALLDNVSAVVREAGCPVVVVPRPPVVARQAADAAVVAYA